MGTHLIKIGRDQKLWMMKIQQRQLDPKVQLKKYSKRDNTMSQIDAYNKDEDEVVEVDKVPQ